MTQSVLLTWYNNANDDLSPSIPWTASYTGKGQIYWEPSSSQAGLGAWIAVAAYPGSPSVLGTISKTMAWTDIGIPANSLVQKINGTASTNILRYIGGGSASNGSIGDIQIFNSTGSTLKATIVLNDATNDRSWDVLSNVFSDSIFNEPSSTKNLWVINYAGTANPQPPFAFGSIEVILDSLNISIDYTPTMANPKFVQMGRP